MERIDITPEIISEFERDNKKSRKTSKCKAATRRKKAIKVTEQLRCDIRSGMTLKELSIKYKVPMSSIAKIIQRGEKQPYKSKTVARCTEQMKYDIESGNMVIQQIANKYNMSVSSVHKLIREEGLEYKPHKGGKRGVSTSLTPELLYDIEHSDMKLKEIADKHNINVNKLSDSIKRSGINYTVKRQRKELSPELVYDIEHSNMTLQQIGDKYGVSATRIRHYIRDNNLTYKSKMVKLYDTQEIVYDLKESDLSLKQIADKYCVTVNAVKSFIKRNNIDYRRG